MLQLVKTSFTVPEAITLCQETADRLREGPRVIEACEAAINLFNGKGDPQKTLNLFRDTFATYLPEMWPVIDLICKLHPDIR